MQNNKTVIDFHIHLINYDHLRETAYQWFGRMFETQDEFERYKEQYSDPDSFCKLLQENGVDYAVILAEISPLVTGLAPNELVRDFCTGREELIPFCTLNPYVDTDLASTLDHLCSNEGFKGIKLYPTYNHFYPNDPKLYPLYAAAQNLNIPVLFHTGSSIFHGSRIKYGNPLFIDDIAVDFPDLKIVMAHGGRGVWYQEALLMVRLHQNVYIDVSGLPPKKLLDYFPDLERFSGKFIFGSDWPGVDIKRNIIDLCSLDLSQEAKERILGLNAKKLLGIE
ncbi:MAG: amidohydrolase family protein [bacterium]|jgi:predicted TIM-barrel fold metal-dependent hydrolase